MPQGPLQRAVRLGPTLKGEARTIERQDAGVEVMDTVQVRLSSWKQSGGAQRWLCVHIPARRLEVFIPLDYFEHGPALDGVAVGDHVDLER